MAMSLTGKNAAKELLMMKGSLMWKFVYQADELDFPGDFLFSSIVSDKSISIEPISQHSVLNFLNSSSPSSEAFIFTQSAGFGIMMAMYPSRSACSQRKHW